MFYGAGQNSYGCCARTNAVFLLPTVRLESCCLTECSCYSDYCFASDLLETLLEMSQALLIYFHQGNIRKPLLICFKIFSPGERSRNVTFNNLSFFFFPPHKCSLVLSDDGWQDRILVKYIQLLLCLLQNVHTQVLIHRCVYCNL